MLTHLRKMDVLSSAEETKIKGAGRLQDQVNMFTTIVTGKDSQGCDALRAFIESSDSQVAQLIINHGKGLDQPVSWQSKYKKPDNVVNNMSQFTFLQIPW